MPDHQNAPQIINGRLVGLVFITTNLAFALLLDYFIWNTLRQDPLLSWLIAVNTTILIYYVLDWASRRSGYPAFPVSGFLIQALVGGVVGAGLGMWLFNHQPTRRVLFRYLPAILAAQFLLLVVYWLIIT